MVEPSSDELDYDPVFLNSRREAKVIFLVWLGALLWCVPTSYWLGYGREPGAAVELILGMPLWLFWGVAMPWLAATLVTTWFCFFYMTDDELDEVEGETE